MTTVRTPATGTPTTTTAAVEIGAPASTTGAFSAADEAFFRITASLFTPSFVYGAGVLLGSYDDEDEPGGRTTGQQTGTTLPADTSASA